MSTRIESHAEPIPGYRLLERLGGGGFGEVWKAEAPGGLHKAIKFVYGDLDNAKDGGQRAEQELRALNRVKSVRHPYILSLERIEIVDGQLMIVMELADRSLWDRFKECRAQVMPGIPREELMRYMEETAEALDLMNGEYGLQHLDIKPQNLFLVHSHVKVADFGLVKDLEGMQASVTGGVTPVYAAPEIFDGRVSRFSDQYSLAIVYQELLTGQRPFAGTNVRQLVLLHMQAAPDLSALPPSDQAVIGRSLSKVPAERFPKCMEMVAALRRNTGSLGAVSPSRQLTEGGQAAPAVPQPFGQPTEEPATNPNLPANVSRQKTEVGIGPSESFGSLDLPGPATEGDAAVGARREVRGDGCLFPALVVGLGQVGMLVLQRLRAELHDQFGNPAKVPNVRLLLIDADPAAGHAATHERPGAALSPAEVLITPLNRPSHYLKPREDKPGVEVWINPRMLYRIPRSQVPSGVRALGRLAYCDNYRHVSRRIRQDVENACNPETLKRAADETGLGLRSSRPRVYVVASLAGGTGGGMFLDVAYSLRFLLKELGYAQPDVVGLFFLPPTDSQVARAGFLGNTYAALTELSYYGNSATSFQAHYLERDDTPVADADPPFTRTMLLGLPEESNEVRAEIVLGRSARILFHDLFSSLGRSVDLTRAGLSAPRWDQRGLCYQTAGLYQITWPRRDLLRAAARRLSQRVVQTWMTKDGAPVRHAVESWINEQMEARELGTEHFIRRLNEECAKALRAAPEDTIQAILKPLTARLAPAEKPGSKGRIGWLKGGSRPVELPFLPTEAFAVPLQCLEELIGKPGDDAAETQGQATTALRAAGERLAGDWGQKLAELHVQLIERPGYRLAGAEESIRHVVAAIEKVLQHYEPLLQDLQERAADAYARLQAFAAAPPNGQRPGPDLLELLKSYPKWRYQSLVVQQVIAAFVGLRGNLSDELREVNFCRVRLIELLRLLETEESSPFAGKAAAGIQLFDGRCKDLEEAVATFLGGIDHKALLELDTRIQVLLNKDYTALVHVCLSKTGYVMKKLEAAMRQVAEEFAADHLRQTDVAAMFLEQHPDEEKAKEALQDALQSAAPAGTAGPLTPELCVVTAPAGPAGDRVREWTRALMPDVEAVNGPADTILIYREKSYMKLSELEHLGDAAREAYSQMCAAEHFTPHTRTDVSFRS
jgi:serine/threonine protein kinase